MRSPALGLRARVAGFAVAFALAASLVACGGDPNGLGTPDDVAADPSGHGDGGAGSSVPANATFGERAVARAKTWVDAKVPYCGGPNGGHDVICGGTCVRTGEAENASWDPYRSDCSGFVSYAWALPAPGHVTSGFAPYDDSVSQVIDASDLAPGDALNNDQHVMLFGGWADPVKHVAHILEESDCGKVAREKDVGLELDGKDSVTILDTTGRVFHAIRYTGK